MRDKIQFKFLGMEFNSKGYTTFYDDVKQINIGCVGGGMMVKQYVKHQYPNQDIKVWVKSDRYSGGSSLNIYLSTKSGDEVSREIYEDVKTFGNTLQWGNFNGMIDSYEPKDLKHKTNEGVDIRFTTTYVFTYNQPPIGSKEYEMSRELENELV
jgi:hypothetical protein